MTVDKFPAQVVLLQVFTKKVEVNHVLLSGADILIENAKLSYIDVAISLKGGNLHVSPLKAEIGKGTIDAVAFSLRALLTYAEELDADAGG